MTEHKMRCGDEVHHKPSGEIWIVAYADYDTGWMAWAGWPEGEAKITDCEIIKPASDEEHRMWVERFMSSNEKDRRHRAVERLYGAHQ